MYWFVLVIQYIVLIRPNNTIYYIDSSRQYNILYWLIWQHQYIVLVINTMTIFCIGWLDYSNTTIYCNNTIILCRRWYWTYELVQSIPALQHLYNHTIDCLCPWDKNNILHWLLQECNVLHWLLQQLQYMYWLFNQCQYILYWLF